MQSKKTPNADLESKRGIMFLIGLLVALAMTYSVFNYETPTPTFEQVTVDIPAQSLDISEINFKP
ncbi:MAG: hypothetical protein J6V76_00710 [Bacteroidales bacterium]|nr:hypothetical protein [Bacteroidales bacterium]MBO7141621.1 hypothetical protein [Bacteroidales bacterium]